MSILNPNRTFYYILLLSFFVNKLYSQTTSNSYWDYETLEEIKIPNENYILKKDTLAKTLTVGRDENHIQLTFKKDTVLSNLIIKNIDSGPLQSNQKLKYIAKQKRVDKKNSAYKKLSKTTVGKLVSYEPLKTNNNSYFCIFKAVVRTTKKKGKGLRKSKELILRVIELQKDESTTVTYSARYSRNAILHLVPFPYEGEYVVISIEERKKNKYLTAAIRYLRN